MTMQIALGRQTRGAQFPTKEISPIQGRSLRIEAEDRDTEFVSSLPSVRQYTAADKYQSSTTVASRNGRRYADAISFKVASLVVDPAEIVRTIEVADLNSRPRSNNGIDRAEVDHPLAAQFDCFIVRNAQRLRFRRLPFHGTSLPETSVFGRSSFDEPEMSAPANNLAPLTSLRP